MSDTFYWEHPETPEKVKEILCNFLHNNRRLRLFDGDSVTGKDWQEEYSTMGTIGRSTGRNKIPLLINNTRSMGGPAILTHCIVKITCNHVTLYQHPLYHQDSHEVRPSDLPEYVEAVYQNGEVVARFKKSGQAARWIEFIEGRSNHK